MFYSLIYKSSVLVSVSSDYRIRSMTGTSWWAEKDWTQCMIFILKKNRHDNDLNGVSWITMDRAKWNSSSKKVCLSRNVWFVENSIKIIGRTRSAHTTYNERNSIISEREERHLPGKSGNPPAPAPPMGPPAPPNLLASFSITLRTFGLLWWAAIFDGSALTS